MAEKKVAREPESPLRGMDHNARNRAISLLLRENERDLALGKIRRRLAGLERRGQARKE